jgi:hypothetical protein
MAGRLGSADFGKTGKTDGDGKSFSGQRSRQLIYLPNTSPFRSDFLVFLCCIDFSLRSDEIDELFFLPSILIRSEGRGRPDGSPEIAMAYSNDCERD